jgi:hypothetical protein
MRNYGLSANYSGWWIGYSGARPVTGQWVASRFGVSMCAHSQSALRSMIDTRIQEDRERFNPSSGWATMPQ